MTCDKDNMSLITIKSVTTPRIVTLLKGFAENRDCTQTLSANRAKKAGPYNHSTTLLS